jgi:thiol:disulfide interchange protein DsbD
LIVILSLVEVSGQKNDYAAAEMLRNNFLSKTDSILEIGIQVTLQKDWHIYWRNPGDSGIPTDFEWKLREGFKAPKIFWPIPKSFEFDDLVSYGFDKQVLFIAELTIPENLKRKNIEISVKLKSLICKNICIPFDTSFTFEIDLSYDYFADEETSKAFSQTKKNLPKLDKNLKAFAKMESEIVLLDVHEPSKNLLASEKVYFIPYENGIFFNTIHQQSEIKENYLNLKIEPDPFRSEVPKYLFGILVFENRDDSGNSKEAYEINVPIINFNNKYKSQGENNEN